MFLKNLLIISAMLLFSALAMAGAILPSPVVVDLGNQTAYGDMRTARNSKNDVEFIGCGVRFEDLGGGAVFSWGFCQASDADDVRATCFTFNPELFAALNTVAEGSYLTFDWDDDGLGNLTCTRIGTSTQSFYLPKDK